MTTADQTSSAKAATVENSPRLAQFQTEVDRLGVSGGRANTEKLFRLFGLLIVVAGMTLVVVSWFISDSAADLQDQVDMVILAMMGIGFVVIGSFLMAINTMARFLRHWLVRLIYELREQTDKLNEN